MIVEQPPIYPETRIVPTFNEDPAHNRRELDACVLIAAQLGCPIQMPTGTWPIGQPSHNTRVTHE